MDIRLTEEVPMRAAKLSDFIWARAEGGERRRRRAWAALLFAVAFVCLAQDGRPAATIAVQDNAQATSSGSSSNDSKPPTEARDSKHQKVSAAESERKRQISDESTQLLAMAEALKVEVDKTTKDTLSLNVIRKADEIERLAKTVKDKMKQGSGT